MEKDIRRIISHSQESEKAIEAYLRKRVSDAGGLCLKYSNAGEVGYPDRLVVLPGKYRAGVCFVELKSKGEKPRKVQAIRLAILKAMGCTAYVAASKADVDRLIEREQVALSWLHAAMEIGMEAVSNEI